MAPTAVNRIVGSARRAALRQHGADSTDGALLGAFIQGRDEAAFEALVRRHGAMVLGVCRRVLRNHADAEDAFQATFLILARKAASIRAPSAVSNWLYGVAHTTAVKALAMIRKRRTRELEAGTLPRAQACEEVWHAVQALLDAELAALPDQQRIPIVLCALEGKTIQEAARQLGWPHGTVASRLARGRARLARRLAKHGLVVSAATLAATLAHGVAAAQVPPALVQCTVQSAGLFAAGQAAAGLVSVRVAALTQGVIQAMFLSQLKSCLAGVVVLAVLSAGAGSLCTSISPGAAFASPPAAQDAAQPPRQTKPDNAPVNLEQEVARLRAELERTRIELQRAQQEIAVLKAQAALVQAEAELVRRRAAEAALRWIGKQNQDNQPLPRPDQPEPPAAVTATSPDGRTVAAGQGTAVTVADAQTGRVLFKATGHSAPVRAVAFSPDGKLLVSGGQDKAVLFWDVQTGKLIRRLVTADPVMAVRFSDDARVLIVRETDQTQREFDTATGKELRVIREAPKRP
jgi:RNA polymerase sigma factor (sigma-70 family)